MSFNLSMGRSKQLKRTTQTAFMVYTANIFSACNRAGMGEPPPLLTFATPAVYWVRLWRALFAFKAARRCRTMAGGMPAG